MLSSLSRREYALATVDGQLGKVLARLGAATPTGQGIGIGQVEAHRAQAAHTRSLPPRRGGRGHGPIAAVVADTRYIAEDAAALVAVDYEPLTAAADCRAALDTDVALVLDTDLIVEGSECSFGFLLVPTSDGVNELLTRLGLGE